MTGTKAVDGCGTARSTRCVRQLGFDPTGVDIAPVMIAKAGEVDPPGVCRLVSDNDLSGLQAGAYDLVLFVFTFDNISGSDAKVRLFHDLGVLLNASGKMIARLACCRRSGANIVVCSRTAAFAILRSEKRHF